MLVVKCKLCGKELTSTTKVQCCGCPNMMKVVDDKVGAMNLGEVLIITTDNTDYYKNKSKLSASDMEWQESRKKRKVRRLDFEIR